MRVKVTEADPAYFKINLSRLHYLNCPAILGRTCPDHTCAKRLPIVLPRPFFSLSFGPQEVNLQCLYPREGRAHLPPASVRVLSRSWVQHPTTSPLIHCTANSLRPSPGAPLSAQRAPSTLCVAWLGGEAEEPALCSSVSGCGQGQG